MTVAEVINKYRLSDNKLYLIGFIKMSGELKPHLNVSGMTIYRWACGQRPGSDNIIALRGLADLPEVGKWSAWASDMLTAMDEKPTWKTPEADNEG